MSNQRPAKLFAMRNAIFICLFDRNKFAFWLKKACVASPPKEWMNYKLTIDETSTIEFDATD